MKKTYVSAVLKKCASTQVAFILLPALMALVVIGTLAQPQIGLYRAQKLFFDSLILWAGPVPLPGGLLITGLLTASLALKFLLYSEWRWPKAGIILTHFGALVLLIGGLITALTTHEGFMILPENGESAYIYDYNKRDLFIFKDDTLLYTLPFHALKDSYRIDDAFTIDLQSTCTNCEIKKQEKTGPYKSMAVHMALHDKPEEQEPEENLSGLTFTLTGTNNTNADQDGTYIAFENMPKPIEIDTNDAQYKIIFGKQQRPLPFTLKLIDFVKTTYPGTNKAKSFHSDITVIDGSAQWPARIQMNQPLRYKDYTFYQSSFQQSTNGEVSIFAVVQNKGIIFPYIATTLMALGLILQCLIVGMRRVVS